MLLHPFVEQVVVLFLHELLVLERQGDYESGASLFAHLPINVDSVQDSTEYYLVELASGGTELTGYLVDGVLLPLGL